MLCARSELGISSGRVRSLKRSLSKKKTLLSDQRSSLSTGRLRGTDLFVTRATRTSTKKKKPEKTANRLIDERSPDLVSYAHDLVRVRSWNCPRQRCALQVDWYPWSEEAFAKAREEEKMIFLSVGYLGCHWCHVMESESFNNPAVAKVINENYVPIKVDREERPDVDRLYSIFLQGSLGFSGWPLNVFLTPELDPMFGVTYVPQPSRLEIPEFKEVLTQMLDGWNQDKEALIEAVSPPNCNDVQSEICMWQARGCTKEIQTLLTPEPIPFDQNREDGTTLVDDVMDACSDALIKTFDEKYGGFEEDAKFPRPSSLKLLMRQYARRQDADRETLAYLLKVLIYTVGALHDGGIHDHIGGGFHRFAIDRIWHVPHFEKMLIDNVQIAQCYLAFAIMMPDKTWFETARSTLDYLLRELRGPEGGFYSGQDADSFDKELGAATEGAFYVWQAEEIDKALTKEESEVFKDYYSVTDEGNCNLAKSEEEEEILTNCLAIGQNMEEFLKTHGMEEAEMKQLLGQCKEKLYKTRSKRTLPQVDQKMVCGYNGLAISAFAEASRVLHFEVDKEQEAAFPNAGAAPGAYLTVALEIGEFILNHLWAEDEQILYRFYMNGTSSVPAYAEDYAFTIAGFLDLYTCSGQLQWLQWALRLQDRMNELFWDPKLGGYFSTSEDNQNIPFRMKFSFDTEEPSASSVAVSNLLRLSGIIEDLSKYDIKAKETVEAFSSYANDNAMALPEFASSVCLVDVHPALLKIVLVGSLEDEKSQEYLNAMFASYAPSKSLIAIDPSSKENLEFWDEHTPELMQNLEEVVRPKKTPKRRKKKGEKKEEAAPNVTLPAVFVCERFQCAGPFDSPEMLSNYMLFSLEEEIIDDKGDTEEDQGEPELFDDVADSIEKEDAIDVEQLSNESE